MPNIKVKNGKVDVNPDPVPVNPNDKVQWQCDDGDFGILFVSSPFKSSKKAVGAKKGVLSQAEDVKTKSQRKGKKDFKYVVAVHVDGGDPPVLIADPVLIVNDGGGGGQKKKGAKPASKKKAKK